MRLYTQNAQCRLLAVRPSHILGHQKSSFMPAPMKTVPATLESLMRSSLERLLDDAAELQSKGLLKQVQLPPGLLRPEPQKLRITTPR